MINLAGKAHEYDKKFPIHTKIFEFDARCFVYQNQESEMKMFLKEFKLSFIKLESDHI